MMTVLVTGGIASGKTVVCRYLASKGYPVYDSDSRTKALYDTVPGLKGRIEKGIGVPMEKINIIFHDPDKRRALEDIVYPEVLRDFKRWQEEQNAPVVIFESAVALDKALFRDLFDLTVWVEAPVEARLSRNPKTAERLASQSSERPSTDLVLKNDSTLENLYRQIDKELICKLI